jgi:hypothetical protein
MMVGKRFFSEGDMLRMQRDAEERVREMQARARRTAALEGPEDAEFPAFVSPNRNWRQNPGGWSREELRADRRQNRLQPPPRPPGGMFHVEPPPPPAPTTVIDDIVGALGMEQDTLLIIGLILILINQKADPTLIMALAYLLL